MTIVACIFARGGSKGLPRKNLAEIDGVSLLRLAVEAAQNSALVDRVVVSTDDRAIAAEAQAAGAEVPFLRPSELATDDAPEWQAWRHALTALGGDIEILVSVPTTAPLRRVEDIDRCIDLVRNGDTDAAITVSAARRNPFFNMVQLTEDGTVSLLAASGTASRRQDAPVVYDIATVAYAARSTYVMTAENLFAGRVKAVEVPPDSAIDIDTALDLEIARCLFIRRKES